MSKFQLITIIFLVIPCITTNAQLHLNAEVRPRAEIRDGYKQLSDTLNLPAFFVSQRSRLSLGFDREKYQLYFAIQDIRVWGDELNYSSTGIKGDNASIDLKEAWFKLFFTKQLALKIGRQELKYADQRLIGGRNWNQHGMSYDALLLTFEGPVTLHAGFSYNNNTELIYQQFYSADKMKTLNFLYLNKQWNDIFTSSFLYVLSGFQHPDQSEKIFFRNTPGILITYNLSRFKFNSSGYYQFGRNMEGAAVSAYFWNLQSEFSLPNTSVVAGVNYLSGHNYASKDSSYLKKDHLFDILYGARHRYYGHMDYFSNIQKGTAGGGLIDVYFDSKLNFLNNFILQGTYHYFRLQNNIPDAESGFSLDKTLANEFDLALTYKPSKEIKVEMGYSFILSTETLNKIQNVSGSSPKDAHYIWLMCTVTPSFTINSRD